MNSPNLCTCLRIPGTFGPLIAGPTRTSSSNTHAVQSEVQKNPVLFHLLLSSWSPSVPALMLPWLSGFCDFSALPITVFLAHASVWFCLFVFLAQLPHGFEGCGQHFPQSIHLPILEINFHGA